MEQSKLQRVMRMINDNIDIQRGNHPDSPAATGAREENRRLFALLDAQGVGPDDELHKAALAAELEP